MYEKFIDEETQKIICENILQEVGKRGESVFSTERERLKFIKAWNKLSKLERIALNIFYMQPHKSKTEAIDDVCAKVHYERTKSYRIKNIALARLTRELF